MKFILFVALIAFCHAAPAPGPEPEPIPKPVPIPSPKPNPSLIIPGSPVITSPVISYSQSYFKSPLYPSYSPYIYTLGYASAYPYSAYPYYVPLHYI